MSEMSMNKVIHGAFRRDLGRFIAALRAFPAGDLARARQLATAWENFDDQLTHHHEGEHEIAWPALASIGVSQDLLTTMDAEHDTMAAALADARTSIAALARTAEPRGRRRGAGRLRGAAGRRPSRTSTTRRPSSSSSTSTTARRPR